MSQQKPHEPVCSKGEHMADSSLSPMPHSLRDAFHFAILNALPHWNGEDPDTEFITLAGKPASPSAICGLVMNYDDLMPEYIYEVLGELGYADADHSHAAGARFLMALINERRAKYQSRQL
jgi:hypothetical protein